MKKNFTIASIIVLFLLILSGTTPSVKDASQSNVKALLPINFKEKLSEYGFFEGKISDQKPTAKVMPYALNAALFSDYAYKLRLVQLPDNQSVMYNEDSVFSFQKGLPLLKHFIIKMMNAMIKKGGGSSKLACC